MERWKKQTIFYDKEKGIQGNCMQACIASILNLPMESVPHFVEQKSWFKALREFLTSQGYILYERHAEGDWEPHIPTGYHLVCGPAERGCDHVVIYHNGRLFFDPHPSNAGLLKITDLWMLVPLDPAYFEKPKSKVTGLPPDCHVGPGGQVVCIGALESKATTPNN